MGNSYNLLWQKSKFLRVMKKKSNAQLNNYRENMGILIERIKDEVRKANSDSQKKR